MLAPHSRARLTPRTADRFTTSSLFDRVARVLCEADCLPRKELFESWEVARRARRVFRGGRVVDLACGHGLVAQLMLVLDDTSPCAIAIDRKLPPSAARVHEAMTRAWPRLTGRATFQEGDVDSISLTAEDLVVATHACGALTDRVLTLAANARARICVLPCCHDETTCDTGALTGWLDAALAIDVTRARSLASRGYRVRTQTIPASITPKNRLILASPEDRA